MTLASFLNHRFWLSGHELPEVRSGWFDLTINDLSIRDLKRAPDSAAVGNSRWLNRRFQRVP